MTTPEPDEAATPSPDPAAGDSPAADSPFFSPAGLPAGVLALLPPPDQPGVQLPAFGLEFAVSLTAADANGNRWAVLTVTDSTVTANFRIPWQVLPQVAQGLANGMMGLFQKAQTEAGPQLIVPNGAAGGLIIPNGHGRRG